MEPANKTIAARQAILAALPLPSDIPEDSIEPIVLPASCTLHDFLRNTTGVRPFVSALTLLTLPYTQVAQRRVCALSMAV